MNEYENENLSENYDKRTWKVSFNLGKKNIQMSKLCLLIFETIKFISIFIPSRWFNLDKFFFHSDSDSMNFIHSENC